MHRLWVLAAIGVLLSGCSAVPDFGQAGGTEVAHLERFSLEVAGQEAVGTLAVPAGDPKTLVVLAHPWAVGTDVFKVDLQRLAHAGVLAVAMEFRGDWDDFKVAAGVEDTVAATLALQAEYPSLDRTLLYGWSMGGEIALLSVAQAPAGTYDYVFEGAGVTDLAALWHSFVMARPAIEAETGGTPAEVPGEYVRRSPIERVGELQDKGVARYFIVHGAGDAPVPVEQAERMYSKMADAGLPVSYYVVTTNEQPWLCVPVVTLCAPNPPMGIANHEAGGLRLMQPFLDHRIQRLPDPAGGPMRGTYDGETGTYEPSDVGS
jgi:dipeptidyl aminopeptidase/acylaminoacyl peptidase